MLIYTDWNGPHSVTTAWLGSPTKKADRLDFFSIWNIKYWIWSQEEEEELIIIIIISCIAWWSDTISKYLKSTNNELTMQVSKIQWERWNTCNTAKKSTCFVHFNQFPILLENKFALLCILIILPTELPGCESWCERKYKPFQFG